MSWEIYSLGSASSASTVGNWAKNKLIELGYTASWTSSDSLHGTLSITIDGVTYNADLYTETSASYPYYLCVNKDTNDILVTTNNNKLTASSMMSYMVNFALLSGVNAETGENGMFYITKTYQSTYGFSNVWYTDFSTRSVMLLHRAAFAKDSFGNPVVPFVSNLFWGSAKLSVGATITIGTDNFVCLGGYLYAKL